MPTVREVVASIRSMNKLLSVDQSLTDRAIASEIKTTASLLIRRELILKKLWSTQTIFTSLKCVQLCEVPIAECCDYQSDCTIRKSQCKIKGIADLGTYGLAIQGVFNIENKKRYVEVSPPRYANILKMNLPKKDRYYWFSDEFLYVSDPNVEAVNIIAYFDTDVKLEGENCQCEGSSAEDCINPLDLEFKCPEYLIENVKTIVNEKLAQIYKPSYSDNTSNELEEPR